VNISGTFCNGIGPKPITLTGTNHFEGNHDDGLSATSLGAITVNNLFANWNSGYGAYLDNNWVYYVGPTQQSAVGGITVTGYGTFDGNGNNGLGAFSTGAVTMTNLSASNNGNIGVRIGNPVNISAAPGVTITGTNQFNGNGTDGLRIGTYGAITLNNITANWNGQSGYGGGAGGNGVYLDNCRAATPGIAACTATTPKTITLTGVNTFYGNHNNGLFFDASGNVILNKVTADGNNNDNVNASIGSGLYGRSGGSITLTCGSMANNGNPVSTEAYGYHLEATGTITLKGVFSFGNWSGNFTSVPPIITRACPLP
jgi:hypothetical protein